MSLQIYKNIWKTEHRDVCFSSFVVQQHLNFIFQNFPTFRCLVFILTKCKYNFLLCSLALRLRQPMRVQYCQVFHCKPQRVQVVYNIDFLTFELLACLFIARQKSEKKMKSFFNVLVSNGASVFNCDFLFVLTKKRKKAKTKHFNHKDSRKNLALHNAYLSSNTIPFFTLLLCFVVYLLISKTTWSFFSY